MSKKGKGWHGDSRRHSLARKGISTTLPDGRILPVNRFVAGGKKIPEIDVSRHNWSMKINKDGTMKVSLGNWTDAGWYWSGDETDLGIFLFRIMNSSDKDQFIKDMKEEGITYEMLLPIMLEHIDEKDGNGMYSLTGDNVRWKFGETFDLDVGSELDHYATIYKLSEKDREEIEKEFHMGWSGDSANIDKFEETETYQKIKKKFIHELKTSADFEDYAINMDNLRENIIYDMLEYDTEQDYEQFALAFDRWLEKKKKEGIIVKKL